MTELVPTTEIEAKVGVPRHPVLHHGRAASDEKTVYILHSQECLASGIDLRECAFSIALDHGILDEDWIDHQDKPVALSIDSHLLTPVRACLHCGCTDDYGCGLGCWWADVDVCSNCFRLRAGHLDSGPPACANHLEQQHPDGNPPWCDACGWTHGQPAVAARLVVAPKGQH